MTALEYGLLNFERVGLCAFAAFFPIPIHRSLHIIFGKEHSLNYNSHSAVLSHCFDGERMGYRSKGGLGDMVIMNLMPVIVWGARFG